MSAEPAFGEWHALFDGRSLTGWRGYRSEGPPHGWRVVDGAITRVAEGGDLITTEVFGDFELMLEWLVADGGNSGIMYRVTEEAAHAYETGPEMQVLDDAGHRDGQSRLTAAGAVYGLYPAPPGVVRPAGAWNTARIVALGRHIEHWLNGVPVASYEIGSPEWEEKVAGSKFKAWPGYGRATAGHIALQDHGDRVAYRAIRIRALRTPSQETTMSVERTRDAMERYLNSEHRDLSMMAEDVVFTTMATGDEHRGVDGVRRMLEHVYHEAFDATAETRTRIYGEHHAVLEADFVGTHIGTFAGISATGRQVRVPLCVVYDLPDGRIHRGRVYLEIPVLMRQLGVGAPS